MTSSESHLPTHRGRGPADVGGADIAARRHDARVADTCLDCGAAFSLCEHVVSRMTDPMLAFQGKVIHELQGELAEARAALAASEAARADVIEQAAAFWRPVARDMEHGILSVETLRFVAQDFLALLHRLAEEAPDDQRG